jgi:hypothetical protein
MKKKEEEEEGGMSCKGFDENSVLAVKTTFKAGEMRALIILRGARGQYTYHSRTCPSLLTRCKLPPAVCRTVKKLQYLFCVVYFKHKKELHFPPVNLEFLLGLLSGSFWPRRIRF